MSALDDIDYSPTSPSYSPVSPSYRPAPLSPVFRSAAAEDHLPCAQPHPLDEDCDEEERPPPSTSRDKPDAKNKNSKEDSDSDCDEEEKKGKRVKVEKKEKKEKKEEEDSEFDDDRSSEYDSDEEMSRVYKDESNRRLVKSLQRVEFGRRSVVVRVTKEGLVSRPSYFDQVDSLQHGGLRYKLLMDLTVFLNHPKRVMKELQDALRRSRCVDQALFDWIAFRFDDVEGFRDTVNDTKPPMTKALAERSRYYALNRLERLPIGERSNEWSPKVQRPCAQLFVALSILLV